jgi:hypothetical protein
MAKLQRANLSGVRGTYVRRSDFEMQRNAGQPALEALIVCDTTVRKLWLKEGLEKR